MTRIRNTVLGLALVVPAGLLSAQTASPDTRRAQPGPQQRGTAAEAPAARYHLLVKGAHSAAGIVSALIEEVQLKHPSTPDEVKALLQQMRINGGMPNRISMNVSLPRQTQGATFGERAVSKAAAASGGGAASAAYAATGRAAPMRDIVIVLCDSQEEEAQAQRLIPAQLEAAQAPADRSAAGKSREALIRRVTAPGGAEWVWISGEPRP